MAGKRGYLPCFSKHNDKKYHLKEFYENSSFVSKVAEFLKVIVDCEDVMSLKNKIAAKGGIASIDPRGNKSDRKLCESLEWTGSKVYRVDYGDTPYRLCFGLDREKKRCYILALDAKHQTRGNKKHQR